MFFAAARWKARVIKEITPAGDVHARLRWWFRGQRNIEALNPGVFRDDFEVPKEPNDEDLEKRRLRAERHLFREFNDYASSLVDPSMATGLREMGNWFLSPVHPIKWLVEVHRHFLNLLTQANTK
jgi:hypothetical protein